MDGWWCWDVLGQMEPLHMVQQPMRAIQHRVWEALRCHAERQLDVRQLATFRGFADGVDGAACCAALQVASTEKEASLLHGLLLRARRTLTHVRGHGMWTASTCLLCDVAHEDELQACGTTRDGTGRGTTWPRGCLLRLRPYPSSATLSTS